MCNKKRYLAKNELNHQVLWLFVCQPTSMTDFNSAGEPLHTHNMLISPNRPTPSCSEQTCTWKDIPKKPEYTLLYPFWSTRKNSQFPWIRNVFGNFIAPLCGCIHSYTLKIPPQAQALFSTWFYEMTLRKDFVNGTPNIWKKRWNLRPESRCFTWVTPSIQMFAGGTSILQIMFCLWQKKWTGTCPIRKSR